MVKSKPAFEVPPRDILDVAALGDVATLEVALADPERSATAVSFRDAWGYGALHVAATNGQFRICDRLLRAGAEIDQASDAGVTPLMCAAANGHEGLVGLFLSKGANPTLVSKDFETALSFAQAGRLAAIEIALEERTKAKSTDVLEAAANGDDVFVSLQLKDRKDPAKSLAALRATTDAGDNAVIVCSKVGMPRREHLLIVDGLLRHKLVDVDAANMNGSTALMYAARANQLELVELLLSHGANPCLSATPDDASRTVSTMATTALVRVVLEHAERRREFEQLYAMRNEIKYEERPEFVATVTAARQRMLEMKTIVELVRSGQPDPRQ